jgi:hypothetical protein
MTGMPKEQFITQAVFHLLSTTAPHWYQKEFEDPTTVNTKLMDTAVDLYAKYVEAIGEPPNVIAAQAGIAPKNPFVPRA